MLNVAPLLNVQEAPMGIFAAILVILICYAIIFSLIVFPVRMLIHCIIRTTTMWPDEKEMNLPMLLLVFFTDSIGTVVYYFVFYKNPLARKMS
ncbi:MAG: hypothetical protein A3A28_04655 [Candidatus Sungbacteria bacterium RIFCSPLOWO2_01_FULL_47_32]|uniref:Cardiolipin synthase N-terminal domain-containing protein n=1 Tax=Candidatus Sungbacteria bacterium RIFCSPHIGHO2_01_FULL_47_32 TaxID=1802264 RepID=A0A1G2K7Z5_9BACT|nr:MAG: hypothetical protein UX72_C0007G0044 [Parcubacteria group bacterium GW2011_GWA2_47_10]OGZ95574.1 MAG: hypothetical protein A2633_06585 [Candidatus Sungbacteria bacterium RIFCSPHIGHO2_01_FULL_47_32]OGZ99289.1 MAG: hypothetical protein A3D57_05510 [Candidatus Sungbacteria bacterium RIFCSPHIGHO2_02_FULL_46_12]OHA06330.1 MAG: hypothetical protein A3A28_04655 [Candidatus Sungbacteria bacterium RIFCSPLOWO2_01_FULL_47_32]